MYKAMMLINKLISKIKNLKPPATSASIISEVDEMRKQVIDLTEVEIKRIETEDMQSKIKFYTVQRYNDMKKNTTRMINSILNRRTDYVNWKKICTIDDVIVEKILAHLINTIHDLGITIEQAGIPWLIVKKIQATSINTILQKGKRDSMLKKSLNKKELKWVEQLLEYNTEKMLKWDKVHNSIKKIPRGGKPRWFREICGKLEAYENPTLKLKKLNPFTFNRIEKGDNTKWIITKTEVWGKISSRKGK
ncbi:2887_t:CDS:2 [Gigaspora margarita]|uniref:2887_t:CDS:1 n=1 Tax=Gigaspora margarita TaxID=4874 RepID=A0ABN7VNV3_GIGMA|nr:2887_t:CDS:2 [Gigaspora margarita]